MIKLFVADDEELIRQGIRNCIENHLDIYSICGEAPDGEMALPLIQELKPDILIADVRMPFIDGLALSAVVKKTMSWIHIIILSGHDEFEYAQKAVSIGVDAYILKPVNSEKLLKTLEEVTLHIEQERMAYLNIEETLKRSKLEKTIIWEHFLSRLVTGKVPISEVIDFANAQKINIIAKEYVVCRIELPHLNEGDLTKIRLLVDKLFEKQEDIIWFVKGADRFVFIIKGEKDETIRETAYETAQTLRHQFKLYLSLDVSVGIGSLTDRIGELPGSYQDACSVMHGIRLKNNCIVGFDDIKNRQRSLCMDFSSNMSLEEKLRYATKEDLPQIVEKYFCDFNDTSIDSVLYRYYLLMDLMATVSRLSKEKLGVSLDITPQKLLALSESWMECVAYAQRFLEEMMEQQYIYQSAPYSREIQRAKEYINQNYSEPSISLHTVAYEVGFSPNHFSTVFSQETGETFIEYLTQKRLAAAKELLLNTSKKTSDIAFEAGYSDPHYFSYVFKKNVGKSPKEFRQDI